MKNTLMNPIAKVIIGISTSALNKLFTYRIPKDLTSQIDVGSVVLVPFGKGNKLKEAYVLSLEEAEKDYDYELKDIAGINDNVSVMKELLQLAYWMHNRYRSTLTSSLQLMLPRDTNIKLKTYKTVLISTDQIRKLSQYLLTIKNDKRMVKRAELISSFISLYEIGEEGPLCFKEKDVLSNYNISASLLKDLDKKGLISRQDQAYQREISVLQQNYSDKVVMLTKEQDQAIQAIRKKKDESHIFLLHGVTGSGKTEVYMRLIEKVIEEGKQAIVLIPEIGLTPQTIARFTGRFGDIIGVMHSRLNLGERYEQWQKAKNGHVKIMIGARSAVFTPFNSIGIVIIDEEHEHTYKSETNPKYHAREIAIKRSLYHQCPVILGSATPLVDNYYKAMNHQYSLINMKGRAVKGAQKDVVLVDMRQELEAGNTSMLSNQLKEAMKQTLERSEQVILFINRRGFAGSISCRACGYVYQCDHCDVSMTYHKQVNRLICHMCGDSKPLSKTCPVCGSKYIKAFSAGTQKIEEFVSREFPDYKVIRMDQDTTGTKHGHEKILKEFASGQAHILIGTQMVTKGHDFHNVTLVGVLAADISLNVQDYRGGERTFQLITQVIGRTGRGLKPGKAFIQTYQPDHYSIINAIHENYEDFYNEEIMFRQALIYPPFCQLLTIVAQSESDYLAKDFLYKCVGLIEYMYKEEADNNFVVLGPAKTGISKVKGQYRNRLIVKGSSYKKLTLVMKELYNRKDGDDNYKKVRLSMELNPMGFN